MLFLEAHARWLLIVHAVLAASVVAASTHLVLWMRGYPRGRFARRAATVRFAWISFVLYVATAVVGNLIYPVYKVRVRLEYLESGTAVTRDLAERRDMRFHSYERLSRSRHYKELDDLPPRAGRVEPTEEVVRDAAVVARWFDVKEHLVFLGALLAGACVLILKTWNPRRDDPLLARPLFAFAVGAAFAAWMAAIVGIVTASYRSVGGP